MFTKNNFFVKCCVLSAVLLVFVFQACKKDKIATAVEEEKVVTELVFDGKYKYQPQLETVRRSVPEAKAKIDELQQMLRNNKLGIRTDNKVSVAEAIWSIEALANAAQGNATFSYRKLEKINHYLPFQTSIENGMMKVAESEIVAKFNEAVNFAIADELAVAVPQNSKDVVAVDVIPVLDENGTVVLMFSIGIGIDPTCPTCPFGNSSSCSTPHSWYGKGNSGSCSGGPNTGNAAEVIQDFVNRNASYDCDASFKSPMEAIYPNGGRGFFTNIFPGSDPVQPHQVPNPNDNIPGDGYRDNLLFRTSSTSSTGYIDCLAPAEVHFYRNSAAFVIANAMNNSPTLVGYDFYACDMVATMFLNGTQNTSHLMYISAGTFVPL